MDDSAGDVVRFSSLKLPSPFSIPRWRWPWATSLIVLPAVAVFGHQSLESALIYDRAALMQGQIWRLWTCHWVHFGAGHLLWNLLALLPAAAWAEWLAPKSFRILVGLAPGAIGVLLLAADPDLSRYGGLSGIAVAAIVFLAFTALTAYPANRWPWLVVLMFVGIKIVVESIAGHSLFSHLEAAGVRSEPLAHIAGAAAAAAVHFATRRQKI